ncbi:MAG TPA: hypothetical protein VFO37_03150, partial [Chitinophagaceae bacterium]|nr:hypothetical protein [Chitinophagaceae bacterium]
IGSHTAWTKHLRGLLDEDRRMKDDAPFSLQMPPINFEQGKPTGTTSRCRSSGNTVAIRASRCF